MKILLNENISKYRKENKMTQEDLAEALGVTFNDLINNKEYFYSLFTISQ